MDASRTSFPFEERSLTQLWLRRDNMYARTLTGASTESDSMTGATCQSFCASNGYQYAGTEWSRQCCEYDLRCPRHAAQLTSPVCGNDFQNGGNVVTDGCDMPCSGQSNELCGGGNRLTVYHSTPGPTTLSGWSGLGCYTDEMANRALPHQVYVNGGMTLEKCTDKCFSSGFAYAGTEYADECYCGSAIGSSGIPATSGCDMRCAGNANENCGGGNRLNVYQYTATPLPSTGNWALEGATGCYTCV